MRRDTIIVRNTDSPLRPRVTQISDMASYVPPPITKMLADAGVTFKVGLCPEPLQRS